MAIGRGGNKLVDKLRVFSEHIGSARAVRVGFLENATYPDGTPVAMIAAIQDGGAPAAGIPPRPFFRNMVATKKAEWPGALGEALKDNGFDALTALHLMGQGISGQLRQSIVDTNSPPLLPATARRKGSSKPLVDSGHMLQSVDYEVKT